MSSCSVPFSLVIVSSLEIITIFNPTTFIEEKNSLDWMSCRCRFQQLIQPFQGQQSCHANVSWRSRASHLEELLSLLYATSGSEPLVYVSSHERNACGHGYASIRTIAHWACPRADPSQLHGRWIYGKYASCVLALLVQSKNGIN